MDTYKVLNKQTYTNGVFSLVPLRQEDKYDIMKWRNEQMYHLRQATPLTKESQEDYFKTTIAALFENENPNQILFSYLRDGECIGYGGLVHINWIDKNAEVSFIMDTQLEEKEFSLHWCTYLKMLEYIAFRELNLHKIHTYAFDLRPHLYHAIEKAGFTREAVLKEHCLFNGEYKDVIIHSKINKDLALQYREANQDDIDLLYKWANEPTVREQSFQKEHIPYLDHKKWFENKLQDPTSIILIFSENNNTVGQVQIALTDKGYIIGISIDKNQRGKGLAKRMLEKASKYFWKTSDEPILAKIKTTNLASVNSFESAGFVFNHKYKTQEYDVLVYKANKGQHE